VNLFLKHGRKHEKSEKGADVKGECVVMGMDLYHQFELSGFRDQTFVEFLPAQPTALARGVSWWVNVFSRSFIIFSRKWTHEQNSLQFELIN